MSSIFRSLSVGLLMMLSVSTLSPFASGQAGGLPGTSGPLYGVPTPYGTIKKTFYSCFMSGGSPTMTDTKRSLTMHSEGDFWSNCQPSLTQTEWRITWVAEYDIDYGPSAGPGVRYNTMGRSFQSPYGLASYSDNPTDSRWGMHFGPYMQCESQYSYVGSDFPTFTPIINMMKMILANQPLANTQGYIWDVCMHHFHFEVRNSIKLGSLTLAETFDQLDTTEIQTRNPAKL